VEPPHFWQPIYLQLGSVCTLIKILCLWPRSRPLFIAWRSAMCTWALLLDWYWTARPPASVSVFCFAFRFVLFSVFHCALCASLLSCLHVTSLFHPLDDEGVSPKKHQRSHRKLNINGRIMPNSSGGLLFRFFHSQRSKSPGVAEFLRRSGGDRRFLEVLASLGIETAVRNPGCWLRNVWSWVLHFT